MEASVWSDPRYDMLSASLGCDRYSAVARMAFLWATCTDREADVLPMALVSVVLGVPGDTAVSALESAELGRMADDGVQIRGCAGRIEWLQKKRESGRLHGKRGGRPRGDKGSPFSDETVSEGSRQPAETPLTPTPTLTPTQSTHVVATPRRQGSPPPGWAVGSAEMLLETVRGAWPSEPTAKRRGVAKAWARELDLLVRRDGVGRDELAAGLAWYALHAGEDFVPEIRSGKALRAKWGALQAAIKRSERPIRAVRDENDIRAAWDRAAEKEAQWRAEGLLGGSK